jgi:predicted acetyltransferase
MNQTQKSSSFPKILAGCGCLIIVIMLACGGIGAYMYSTGALQQIADTAQTAAGEVIAIQTAVAQDHGASAGTINVKINNNNGQVALVIELSNSSYAALPESERIAKAREIARLANSKLSNTLGIQEICVAFSETNGASTSSAEQCFDRSGL